MKILAADSASTMRQTLRGAIEVLGHGTLEAQDCREVMDILPAHYPDIALIVLDWNLPGVGGHETLERIKKDGRFNHIPVIALIADEGAPDAIEAIQAGASECLMRSFTQQDLATRMLECLSRAA